ncbi:MAG TPA: HpcH/HpaI aldolase/citrate lyase family protein [Arenimonas sp.]|nr:HpcH/HpaI aldolase/citrate lyase family protein [Arenimonas sp.]
MKSVSTKVISPFALGATLYMPATRTDILDVVLGRKIEGLRSLGICLEDSVAEVDVVQAQLNLHRLLQAIDSYGGRPKNGPLVFVRPRNTRMAAALNDWPLIRHVDGFIAPKLNMANIDAWEKAVTRSELMLMPTLETRDVFDANAMVELRDALQGGLHSRIIALRIGGNDLIGCLGLRRNAATTIYATPMSYVIPMLCGLMGAAGFALTAPVFERLDNMALLEEELALDIAHGFVGKTAIHPSQIQVIHRALRVNVDDLNSARLILSEDASAVFRYSGAMCEPATHTLWAQNIIARAKWHGVRPEIRVQSKLNL